MKGHGGPAQPSPLLGDALNAGYRYLKVKCAGCRKNNMVDLANHPAPKGNLEHRMRCKPCAVQRGYPHKRGPSGATATARSRRKTTASPAIRPARSRLKEGWWPRSISTIGTEFIKTEGRVGVAY